MTQFPIFAPFWLPHRNAPSCPHLSPSLETRPYPNPPDRGKEPLRRAGLQKDPRLHISEKQHWPDPQRSRGTKGETESACPGPHTQGRSRNGIQVSSTPSPGESSKTRNKVPFDPVPGYSVKYFVSYLCCCSQRNKFQGWLGKKVF